MGLHYVVLTVTGIDAKLQDQVTKEEAGFKKTAYLYAKPNEQG